MFDLHNLTSTHSYWDHSLDWNRLWWRLARWL